MTLAHAIRSDVLRPRHVLTAVELVVVKKGHEGEAEEGGSGNWESKVRTQLDQKVGHVHCRNMVVCSEFFVFHVAW